MSNAQRPLAFSHWLREHGKTLLDVFAQLRGKWQSQLLNIMVIGGMLALPASLAVLLDNAQAASQKWQQEFSISLFLHPQTADSTGEQLSRQLCSDPRCTRSEFLSRAESLAEFKTHSGFSDALNLLDDNPLPGVIILWPNTDINASELQRWQQQLSEHKHVDIVQADSDWLKRLQALLGFLSKLVWMSGGLLAMTVLVVIGNTIRLAIENRKEEILVLKLIGAPDHFIQRPFLYNGSLIGLFSGILACLCVALVLGSLSGPLDELSQSYGQNFSLQGMSWSQGLQLSLLSVSLGWLGSFWAVKRRLRLIEPE